VVVRDGIFGTAGAEREEHHNASGERTAVSARRKQRL
jgi:hypothetical protein